MKEAKDLFSKQAQTYATYRPVYPDSLYDFLFSITSKFDTAWDCGTGNGQVANRLAERFAHVIATDLSEQQIANATEQPNITYKVARAEHTPIADNSIDLVTIGTALHWFDFDNFYKEVNRVAKDGAHIVAWCYAPFRSDTEIDSALDDFAYNVLGEYWDPERKYVDDGYKTIPFPFEEIATPDISIKLQWTLEQFMGYLNSWSSVQHYINKNGTNPVDMMRKNVQGLWADGEVKQLTFPIFIRAGRISK